VIKQKDQCTLEVQGCTEIPRFAPQAVSQMDPETFHNLRDIDFYAQKPKNSCLYLLVGKRAVKVGITTHTITARYSRTYPSKLVQHLDIQEIHIFEYLPNEAEKMEEYIKSISGQYKIKELVQEKYEGHTETYHLMALSNIWRALHCDINITETRLLKQKEMK